MQAHAVMQSHVTHVLCSRMYVPRGDAVTKCCSLLQSLRIAVCCSHMHPVLPCGDAVTTCCSVLQSHAPSVAVCCSAMWHTACFLFVRERQSPLWSSTMHFVVCSPTGNMLCDTYHHNTRQPWVHMTAAHCNTKTHCPARRLVMCHTTDSHDSHVSHDRLTCDGV